MCEYCEKVIVRTSLFYFFLSPAFSKCALKGGTHSCLYGTISDKRSIRKAKSKKKEE